MPFDLKSFVDSPNIEELNTLKKSEMVQIAKEFSLDYNTKMRKDEIKKIIGIYLVDENYCKESDLEDLNFSISSSVECDNTLELKKIELQAQKEKEEREFKLKEKELEIQKEKEIELRKLELQAQIQVQPQRSDSVSSHYLSKYSSLIPKFDEENVEIFFTQFETQMMGLELDRAKWAFLIRSSVTGKALKAISTLSVDQGGDYDFIKKIILSAYQLVPEAYRQKFRNTKKLDSQTHVEFARQKEILFDRWCQSKEVADFKDLRQLVLVEEFNRCVGEDVKTFLNEQKVKDLTTAATTADEYALVHKPKFFREAKPYKHTSNQNQYQNQNSVGNKFNAKKSHDFNRKSDTGNSIPTCGFCHKKGHIMSKCFKLAHKKRLDGETSTNALSVLDKRPKEVVREPKFVSDNKIKEGYLPFVLEGYISLSGDTSLPPVKIKMLRDTGATQSLLLEGVLPLSEQTSAGADVIIRGVECGYVSVPLHKICLKSDLVSGEVTVGVRPTLPVKGVSFLLGNDLAGEKVVANPIVSYKPSEVDDTEHLQKEFPNLFPACAVTRAMSRKLESELQNQNPNCQSEVSLQNESHELPKRGSVNSKKELSDFDVQNRTLLQKELVSEPPQNWGHVVSESPEIRDSLDSKKELVSEPPKKLRGSSSKKEHFVGVPTKTGSSNSEKELFSDLNDTFMSHLDDDVVNLMPNGRDFNQENPDMEDKTSSESDILSRNNLLIEQGNDPELASFISSALSEDEAKAVPVCFYLKGGILMRKWRPPDVPANDEWRVYHQIVVPKVYRTQILSVAHETSFSGHMGVNKTCSRILNHFYWPKLRRDVANFCKTCHTCQMVGKPNQKIPSAPLKPIPTIGEPFEKVIIDCVGPLPKAKSGHQYLLTIMCASTRFPEAIPLRNIKAQTIIKALIKFFTLVGLPKVIQSDQGSNFMSKVFQQALYELGIEQVVSSAWHPESQGALERFHQTLKNMIRTYCYDNAKDWDEGIHFLLFAARESVQESLGFSPFELLFGHTVRGPLKMWKDKWLDESEDTNLLDYVSKFKYRLHKACEVARSNLQQTQVKMKTWYDKKAKVRNFSPGDKVLVFLPVMGHPLRARYFGPYVIEKKVNDTDYIVLTPDRRKTKRLCHINMLKEYYERNVNLSINDKIDDINDNNDDVKDDVEVNVSDIIENDDIVDDDDVKRHIVPELCIKLQNSDVLLNIDDKLNHLSCVEREQVSSLINEYLDLFSDSPTRTELAYHDVDVGDATPIKQSPYRMNPVKMKHLRDEVRYMLDHDIIEPSDSDWSSPCILVPKPDGSFRFCTDYRKLNSVTKTDSYPIPRIDDCIDKIGNAKYVTKFDLLKGYWGIPLTERAKRVSAFATPDGLYQYKVMPFGMKNAPATFQRLVNKLTAGIDNCEVYIDDIVVYTDTWEDHIKSIRSLFNKLREANLTVNLVKSEIAHAHVIFLGHVVGQGQVKPIQAKVEAIQKFPVPTTKKELMRFLGMAGYYRRFCRNFSETVAPLTNLLSKRVKFIWTDACQYAFDKIKSVLISSPVLNAPNFEKPFKLATDASDNGVGAILLQTDVDGIDHPVSYFSKRFNPHQKNYSTIEKETLALLLALQHFDVYLGTTMFPITVLTDHNPLVFLSRMKNKNQRLVRWTLFLQGYNLDIKHIKGKDNIFPDALSRI